MILFMCIYLVISASYNKKDREYIGIVQYFVSSKKTEISRYVPLASHNQSDLKIALCQLQDITLSINDI